MALIQLNVYSKYISSTPRNKTLQKKTKKNSGMRGENPVKSSKHFSFGRCYKNS